MKKSNLIVRIEHDQLTKLHKFMKGGNLSFLIRDIISTMITSGLFKTPYQINSFLHKLRKQVVYRLPRATKYLKQNDINLYQIKLRLLESEKNNSVSHKNTKEVIKSELIPQKYINTSGGYHLQTYRNDKRLYEQIISSPSIRSDNEWITQSDALEKYSLLDFKIVPSIERFL